ncbi:MAG: GNAT superfamily N-acetyltransferase [Bacteroidia bacterium]
MKLRIGEIEDLETLNSISVLSKSYWNYPKSWIERWMDDLTIQVDEFAKQNILVVEHDGDIIGFSSVVERLENCELLHLWVLPNHIGEGIGKLLLNKTLETCGTIGKPIIVESDPNAEAFYKSQGFVTYDKIESYPKGRFLPLMKKTSVKKV